MASSYNGKSVNLLRDLGYTVEVVERYSPHSRRTHDLFGFLDVLAVGVDRTVGIQVTSRGNMASRRRKILEENPVALYNCMDAGWAIEVHGWDQPGGPRTTWRVKRQTLCYSPEDDRHVWMDYEDLKANGQHWN